MAVTQTQLTQLYLAYFGRPPDASGMQSYLAQPNATVQSVAAAFSASPESQDLYGSTFGAAQVDAIYMNLLNRHAEPDGIDYWVRQVNNGAFSPAFAAYAILLGAQNEDALAVANKLAIATSFFEHLDTQQEKDGYRGNAAAHAAREFLQTVDWAPTSRAAATLDLDAAIAAVIAAGQQGGQGFSLSSDRSSVDEGQTLTFTLSTSGVAPGAKFGYTITGVQADDVAGGALSGWATVGANGQAIVKVSLLRDSKPEVEFIELSIAGRSATVAAHDAVTPIPPLVNQAPQLLINATLPYIENDSASVIAPAAGLWDVDSADFNGGSLTVGFTANGTAADQLAVRNQGAAAGQIGVTGLAVTWGGTVIGTFSGGVNGANLVINFSSAAATLPAVQALVRNITFANTSDAPSTLPRTVGFTVVDGDGTAFGGADTATASATVNVAAVNDAPVVTTSGVAAAFAENGPAVSLDSGLTLADVDSANLSGVTISISSGFESGKDVLSYSGPAPGPVAYVAATGILTISGSATLAEYQTMLRSVQFQSSSDAPMAKTITWVATDSGGASSVPVTSIVNTALVNDAPVTTVPTDNAVGTAFSNTPLSISGVAISDDATTGAITVQLAANGGSLTVSLAGGASVTAGTNGSHGVTLSGTLVQLNAALATLSYRSDDGFTGSDTVSVTTNDGGNTGTGGPLSHAASFHVGVVPQVFIIDNTNGTADDASSGTAANPFNSIASFNSLANDGAGDYIYIKNGTGTYSTASGLTLLNNQQVYGQGQTLQFTNPVTGAVVTVGTGAVGTTPTISITGASQKGVLLAQGNTLKGFNVATILGSQTGIADNNGTVGSLTIADMDVTGTGMAVDIDQGGALAVAIDTLSSSGSSSQALQLAAGGGTTLTGSFSATAGSISGSGGTALWIGDNALNAGSGGTLDISYGGDIAATGIVGAVLIAGRAAGAGTVALSGNVSHSGNGPGVYLGTNAAGTITFSGALSISTGNNVGIQISSSGGTVNFTGSQDISTTTGAGISLSNSSAAVNFNTTGTGLDIATTGGIGILTSNNTGSLTIQGAGNEISNSNGTGISLSNTTIGASGLNFKSINASNGANGIYLNNTGTTGSLTVTGDGVTANSGGTISNTTGDGIIVTSGVFNLDRMLIQNAAGNGINVSQLVGSSSLNNSTVTGFDAGGTNTEHGLRIVNTGTNAGTMTVSGSTFSAGSSGADGIYMRAQGSGNMTLNVSGSTFTGLHGDGIQIDGFPGATSTIKSTIQNSTFSNAVASTGDGGIKFEIGGNANLFADVNGNTLSGIMNATPNTGAVKVENYGTADSDITIRSNTISNVAVSNGILIYADSGTADVKIDNNTIDALGSTGKSAIGASYFTANGNIIVSNNMIGQTGNLWTAGDGLADAVWLQAVAGAIVNASVANNTVDANTTGYVLSLFSDTGGAYPSPTMNATVTGNDLQDTETSVRKELYLRAGNASDGTLNVSATGNKVNGGRILLAEVTTGTVNVTQLDQATFSTSNNGAALVVTGSPTYNSAAPTLPTTPSLPLVAADLGSGAGDLLTLDQLGGIVAAAAQRWDPLLTDAQRSMLAGLGFVLADMDGTVIGTSASGLVLIDRDAAGHGWYVDTTPADDAEFEALSATRLVSTDIQAAGRLDLLTAVMHEIGHALGLDDAYANAQDSVMDSYLQAGERHLPSAPDLAQTVLVGVTEVAGH